MLFIEKPLEKQNAECRIQSAEEENGAGLLSVFCVLRSAF
jgi:hypothetical protein